MEKAIPGLNKTVPVAMEFFGSSPDTPYDTSMKKVAESDIYVGLFAHRYGSILPRPPAVDDGGGAPPSHRVA